MVTTFVLFLLAVQSVIQVESSLKSTGEVIADCLADAIEDMKSLLKDLEEEHDRLLTDLEKTAGLLGNDPCFQWIISAFGTVFGLAVPIVIPPLEVATDLSKFFACLLTPGHKELECAQDFVLTIDYITSLPSQAKKFVALYLGNVVELPRSLAKCLANPPPGVNATLTLYRR